MSEQLNPLHFSWHATFSERMAVWRAYYDAGIIPALYDALTFAEEYGAHPPDWAIKAATQIVKERIENPKILGKGPKGNELSNYRTDMKHLFRWQIVKGLRAGGMKLDKAYVKTQERLVGNFAAGGPDAIKKSYDIVQKNLKDPDKALKYYRASNEMRELTGTQVQ